MSRILRRINETLADYESAKDGPMTGLMFEEYAEQLYWALIAASTEIRCLSKNQCQCGTDGEIINHIKEVVDDN